LINVIGGDGFSDEGSVVREGEIENVVEGDGGEVRGLSKERERRE
jgi:hypothetical protein